MSVSEEEPPDSPKEVLTWRQTHSIFLPPDDDEVYVLLRLPDYERLERHVEELPPQGGNLSAAYWALFSTSVAVGATVPALLWATGLPTWVAATYIVTASAFLVIGIVLLFVGRLLGKKRVQGVADIAKEMRDIVKRIEVKKARKPGRSERADE